MKAIRIHQFGAPEVNKIRECALFANFFFEVDPVAIIGLGISIIGLRLSLIDAHTNETIHAALYRSLEKGSLRPIVAQEFPLSEAARAHHAVEKSGSLGKICWSP